MRRRGRAVRALAALCYVALLVWSLTTVTGFTQRRSISVLCSSIEDSCRAWARGFTDETGIEVAMVRASTGEALARLSRADASRDFDVWHGGGADVYEIARARGLLAAYHSPNAAAVPARFADAEGYWTGTYLGVLGFCSNVRILDRLGVGVPATWDDLLDPRLAGQVSMPSPVTSGTGYTVLWTNWLRLGADERALGDYLRAVDANVLQYTASGLAPARVAGHGEVAVAVGFTQHCVKAQQEGFTDLVVSYPPGGAGFEVGAVAVLAGARDRQGAERYVDYALSRSAQLSGADTHSVQLPTRRDLAVDPRLGGGVALLDYSVEQAAAAREALTALFRSEVHR